MALERYQEARDSFLKVCVTFYYSLRVDESWYYHVYLLLLISFEVKNFTLFMTSLICPSCLCLSLSFNTPETKYVMRNMTMNITVTSKGLIDS